MRRFGHARAFLLAASVRTTFWQALGLTLAAVLIQTVVFLLTAAALVGPAGS